MARRKKLTGEELHAYVAKMDAHWEAIKADRVGNEIVKDFADYSVARLNTIRGQTHVKSKLRKEQ